MQARINDHIVVEGTHLGLERRIGIIVGIDHPDGSPPYRVHWLDNGRTTLFFPGPEAHIAPAHGSPVGPGR
ncbi:MULTISPECIES: DUF1918 domain-containing protein [Actinoplanes]|uniref:DNA-binding protein n=2 Tax=Actinoplanes TaxID=1865 RepID=A0A101JB06_9ACTN|nr:MULTISPECIES: DUF1918 domain-containing protein [Actinoplanes]KUL23462.1 DNA-binding protein [Actinoplanes awajinensis subsp. mycoplanecinus]GIE68232.1 hypothetical protein Apa02nite_043400 [Actinoplanes palleronii]